MSILRKDQQPPSGNWSIWLLLAGRGFGKTLAGSMAIASYIIEKKAQNIGIIGASHNEILNVMIFGVSGLFECLKILKSKLTIRNNKSEKIIQFSNGVKCFLLSANHSSAFRGFQFDLVWIDEFCKFRYPTDIFNSIKLCLRLGLSQMIITTTPKNIPILHHIINQPCTKITRGNSFQNKKNLSDNFVKTAKELVKTPIGQQEIMGQIISETLWIKEDIQYKQPNKIIRYRLGIDPAVSGGLTGLILVGLGEDNLCYVLEDFSTHSRPEYWFEQVKFIINTYKPIEISVEVNQGGNLIGHLLDMHAIKCTIIYQRAIQSKEARNLSTYFLYKTNQVFHSKVLGLLEEEMITTQKDRVDALTWAVYQFNSSRKMDLCFV